MPLQQVLNYSSMIVPESMDDAEGMNFSQEFFFYHPFDPLKDILMWRNKIRNVYNRGPGKGVLCAVDQPIFGGGSHPPAKLASSTVVFAGGGPLLSPTSGRPVPVILYNLGGVNHWALSLVLSALS